MSYETLQHLLKMAAALAFFLLLYCAASWLGRYGKIGSSHRKGKTYCHTCGSTHRKE